MKLRSLLGIFRKEPASPPATLPPWHGMTDEEKRFLFFDKYQAMLNDPKVPEFVKEALRTPPDENDSEIWD